MARLYHYLLVRIENRIRGYSERHSSSRFIYSIAFVRTSFQTRVTGAPGTSSSPNRTGVTRHSGSGGQSLPSPREVIRDLWPSTLTGDGKVSDADSPCSQVVALWGLGMNQSSLVSTHWSVVPEPDDLSAFVHEDSVFWMCP